MINDGLAGKTNLGACDVQTGSTRHNGVAQHCGFRAGHWHHLPASKKDFDHQMTHGLFNQLLYKKLSHVVTLKATANCLKNGLEGVWVYACFYGHLWSSPEDQLPCVPLNQLIKTSRRLHPLDLQKLTPGHWVPQDPKTWMPWWFTWLAKTVHSTWFMMIYVHVFNSINKLWSSIPKLKTPEEER